MSVTPRRTRLLRAVDLRAFRSTLVALACEGDPLDARDRIIVVPTRAAAAYLTRSIDAREVRQTRALILPDLIAARELVDRLAARLPVGLPALTTADREALLGRACRAIRDAGVEPPFRLRPALVAEMLQLYDTIRWNGRDIEAFERIALGRLEPGAEIDRGAERLVRQTRFLVAAFRSFEERCAAAGADAHQLRSRILAEPAARPVRHVVVAVGGRAFDRHGLYAAEWDLLARVPGLQRLDVVTTDTALAGAPHERIHAILPGIEEVRVPSVGTPAPLLHTAGDNGKVHVTRDREEEVAGFARLVKSAVRRGELVPDRAALVVRAPLPYVYLASDVFRSARLPWQMVDALPLAAEPYAAALDLVCTAVASSFARGPAIALLRCRHFDFTSLGLFGDPDMPAGQEPAVRASLEDVAALDRELSECGYLGEVESLERLMEAWQVEAATEALRSARRAVAVLLSAARELAPLRTPAPASDHLDSLARFLIAHDRPFDAGDPLDERHRRARAAVLGVLQVLREAYARFDTTTVDVDLVASLVRRWIEGQTFAARGHEGGVHVVDADTARFGDFDFVQLAGLVDGEWPDRPRRNVFYAPDILRDMGWPGDADRRDAARAQFVELLRSPAARVAVSTFVLESDALVSPSALLDELETSGLDAAADASPASRVFDYEALGLEPVVVDAFEPFTKRWALFRLAAPARGPRGRTGPHTARAWSVSALERYQDCPFRFFSADVLKLDQPPDDGRTLSPRARGRFVHEVLQRFIESWDARGGGAITPVRLPEARAIFAETAERLLARLPGGEVELERVRLFGSAVAMGAMDILLGVEVSWPEAVRERWLEYRLEGNFALGADASDRVLLRGVVDRVDLLPGRRLRVIDYKTGLPPHAGRALQVPIYALSVQERLEARDAAAWQIEEAVYVRLAGARSLVPVVSSGDRHATETLELARGRLRAVLDGIGRGEFPPRPHDPTICTTCAFASVCRKEYVDRA